MMGTQVRSFIRFFFEVGVFFFATALAFLFFTEVYPLGDGEGVTVIFPYTAAVFVGGILYMIAYMIGGASNEIERGERLSPTWKVKLRSWWRTLFDPHPFFWGGVWHPFAVGVYGLEADGLPGVGKSIAIRLLLQSVLPGKIGLVPEHRALLYDAVTNYFPILAGMGIDVSEERGLVKTLHPYDLRAWAWEMWLDVRDFATIDEIAVIFIPIQETGERFWSDMARALLKGILKALIARGTPWSLWDVCYTMRSLDRIKDLLGTTPETEHLIERILEKGKVTESIDATLYSHMERFEVIAAIWKRIPTERHMSLTEWLTNEKGSIILVGRAARGTAHDAINQLIIERLGQLITIHLKESSTSRTLLVIDEIRQQKFNLNPIATMGRARGVGLVAGYQDKPGLEDAYGERPATEMLGMFQIKMFFRLGTYETATYAANEMGKQDYKDEQGNEQERWVVHPNEFTSIAHLPETNRRNGCTFYVKSVAYGPYKMRIRGRKLFGKMLRPLDTSVAGFIARPASDQYFVETTVEPEGDEQEREREKPRLIETTEVQNERAEAADERAKEVEKVKQRQREARERRSDRTTNKQRNAPPPDMTIQELLRSLDADEL
jgi:hypothetical protein